MRESALSEHGESGKRQRSELRTQITDVKEQTDLAEARHDQMQLQIADFQRRLGIAETATTSSEIRTVEWDRRLDPGIIQVSTDAHVPAAAPKEQIDKWLEEAKIDEDKYTLENSNDPTKDIVVRFTGTPYVADQAVGKALASNNISANVYKEFTISIQPNKIAKL